MNSNINNTSSKPIKKMVLWTRINNSKSASPHLKENANTQHKNNIKVKDCKKVKESINLFHNEKKILSPTVKTKDASNFSNNRNYLNYTRLTTNKILNSQGGGSGSFQSNSNEEDKNNSKINESSNKKKEKDTQFINNIKYKKNININYCQNDINTNNINSSEFHINKTYKYFQSTNEGTLKKKENKSNCITDNNVLINQSKNIITKKKISLDNKGKKKLNNSKKKLSPNNTHNAHKHQISPTSNKINTMNNSNINNSLNNNKNISYTIFNQCKRNMNSISSTQKLNKNTYNEVLNDSNFLNNKKSIEKINKNKNNSPLEKLKFIITFYKKQEKKEKEKTEEEKDEEEEEEENDEENEKVDEYISYLKIKVKLYQVSDGHLLRFIQDEGNREDFLDKFGEISNFVKKLIS